MRSDGVGPSTASHKAPAIYCVQHRERCELVSEVSIVSSLSSKQEEETTVAGFHTLVNG